MQTQTSTIEDMQAEHRQWDYVHSAWRVDIERWRGEYITALSELAKLQETLHPYGDTINEHAESMERLDSRLRDHERALAEFKGKGDGQLQEALELEHRKHAELHSGQCTAHDRIQKHHQAVMTQLRLLKAAIEDAL